MDHLARHALSRSAPRATARARTSRCSPRSPTRVELCLFDDAGTRDARRLCPRSTPSAGTATCRASGRASATASACTARGRPTQGHRCNPAEAAARSVRQGDRRRRRAGTRRCSATASAIPTSAATTSDSAPFVPKSRRRRSGASTGRTTARRARPLHETVIYEVHVKGFTARHPGDPARAARHLRRPRASRRRSST